MTIRLLAIALTVGLGCGDFNAAPTCGSTGQGCCHGLCADGLVCTNGFCGRAALPEGCPAPRPTMCGISCTNTTSDRANCGSCGNACATGQACLGGTCVTPDGGCISSCAGLACGPGSCGVGSCGTCPSGTTCNAGSCVSSCSCAGRACGMDTCGTGSCGTCPSGQTCSSGSCETPTPTCPSGMRGIPAGMFLMGDLIGDDTSAQPVHGVRLTAFCMDETEVTVSAYRSCVTTGTCTTPGMSMYCNWGVSGRDQHPVNCVDPAQARAFCVWRGSDLPTEARWEYAARGTDRRTYPWGNDAPGSQLCWNRLPSPGSSCPVQSYPSGNSPFGLFDMAGNVFEWTLDSYASYTGDSGSYVLNPTGPFDDGSRVLRGGSWGESSPFDVRASHRIQNPLGSSSPGFGFRCARGPI